MGLDYKDIINKHYGLGLSGREIAKQLGVSKSGVNDFLGAFDRCTTLGFPLPDGITNYGIAAQVYSPAPTPAARDVSFEIPNYEEVHKLLHSRKNMTLLYLWNRYVKRCEREGKKPYQYRQFCFRYSV